MLKTQCAAVRTVAGHSNRSSEPVHICVVEVPNSKRTSAMKGYSEAVAGTPLTMLWLSEACPNDARYERRSSILVEVDMSKKS